MLNENKMIKLSIGSQTKAQQARNFLKGKGISAKVIKVESRIKDGGCLFGIEIMESDRINAMRILNENGVYSKSVL